MERVAFSDLVSWGELKWPEPARTEALSKQPDWSLPELFALAPEGHEKLENKDCIDVAIRPQFLSKEQMVRLARLWVARALAYVPPDFRSDGLKGPIQEVIALLQKAEGGEDVSIAEWRGPYERVLNYYRSGPEFSVAASRAAEVAAQWVADGKPKYAALSASNWARESAKYHRQSEAREFELQVQDILQVVSDETS